MHLMPQTKADRLGHTYFSVPFLIPFHLLEMLFLLFLCIQILLFFKAAQIPSPPYWKLWLSSPSLTFTILHFVPWNIVSFSSYLPLSCSRSLQFCRVRALTTFSLHSSQEMASEWLRGEDRWICTQKIAHTLATPPALRWKGIKTSHLGPDPLLLSPGARASESLPPKSCVLGIQKHPQGATELLCRLTTCPH